MGPQAQQIVLKIEPLNTFIPLDGKTWWVQDKGLKNTFEFALSHVRMGFLQIRKVVIDFAGNELGLVVVGIPWWPRG